MTQSVRTRAHASAGATAEKVDETESTELWVVSGGDVQKPKVFALSKTTERRVSAAQEVLRQWGGGVVGRIEAMPAGEPMFSLNLSPNTLVLFEEQVRPLEAAWKRALASTQGVKMWGFYKASGAIDQDTAGAKLVLSTLSPCAVKPSDPGLVKLLEAAHSGAILKTKAKFISMWRVREHEGQEVFAPFGVALIAARKITISGDQPTEITNS